MMHRLRLVAFAFSPVFMLQAACQSEPPARWVQIPITHGLVFEVDTATVKRSNGMVSAWFRVGVGERDAGGKPVYHFQRLELDCPGLRSRLVDTARANGEDFVEIPGQTLDTAVTAWKTFPPSSAGGQAASQICRRLRG